MKRTMLAPFLASILFLTPPPAVLPQTTASRQTAAPATAHDWQRLKNFKPGKQILVELKSGLGDPIEAKFISAVGTTLTLTLDVVPFTVEQQDIQRVYRLTGWSRNKMAKIGAGVGMATGTMIGVHKAIQAERRPNHVSTEADRLPGVIGFFVGSLAGAGIGALLGGKRKGELLYQAK